MDGCSEEHNVCKVGLGETGDTDSTGGERTQGVGKFLQSDGAGGAIVRSGDVVAINSHGEAHSGGTYGFLMTGDGGNGE